MTIIFLIAAAVILRFLPHFPNFAPITALALFAGAKLPKKYALILPLLVMAISDFLLGGYHSTLPFVYFSFFISGLIGFWLRKNNKFGNIICASLIGSVQFFLITNFGVWLLDDMYPLTFAGLMESYTMGLPFYRGTFLGDLFYTGIFFGGYELVKHLSKRLSFPKI